MKFSIVEYLSTDNGDADGVTSSTHAIKNGDVSLVDNFVEIKIDKYHLLSHSLIEIARTFIHEAIHTNLAILRVSPQDASEITGTFSSEEFATLLGDIQDGGHNFMANYYLPQFSEAIEEAVVELYDESRIEDISGLSIGANDGTIVDDFNWEHFYEYFPWSGLEKTDKFNSDIKSITTKKNLYEGYTQAARMFGKNCSN